MSDLRHRLARFDRQLPPAPARVRDREPLGALLRAGARWCGEAPTGYLKIERELGASPARELVVGLDASMPDGDLLVLDTETTGLESGTGTMVFVVGLVRWSTRGQRLLQFFLPEPAGEQAFLTAVLAEFSGAAGFVSYNGRGFDIPRLRSRIRLQKMDDQALDRPHLDLLYPTRRLVRGWLPDARLKTVEEGLLGEFRADDLPGEFAPGVYRDLLSAGCDSGLVDVVRHNAMDVESLPRLVARLSGILDGGWRDLPRSCALQVGRLQLECGQHDRARLALDVARDAELPALRGRARALLAAMSRRDANYRAAASLWEEQLQDQPADLHARVELAKLLEHRLDDLDRALLLIAGARDLATLGGEHGAVLCEQLDHRYRRLVRKRGRKR